MRQQTQGEDDVSAKHTLDELMAVAMLSPLAAMIHQRDMRRPVLVSFGVGNVVIEQGRTLRDAKGNDLHTIRIVHWPHDQDAGQCQTDPAAANLSLSDIWLHAGTPEGIEVLGRACIALAKKMRDGEHHPDVQAALDAKTPRPISEWHEDIGAVLWWRFPVEEPPYAGSPLDSDWPGYHTHFTQIIAPDLPVHNPHPRLEIMVRRGASTDLNSLLRNVAGSITMTGDPDRDVKPLQTRGIDGASFADQDRLNMDFDDFAGVKKRKNKGETP